MLKKILNNIIGNDDVHGKTKELEELFKTPKFEKDVPTFQVFKENEIQQADLLFITNDRGYKYILVVVDDHSKKMDAEKLKAKDGASVLDAFKKIYERDILKLPKVLECDSGTEFKGVVHKYFEEHQCRIRYALTGNHRQQGLVERKNQMLGTIIHKVQSHKELVTGKPNREWVQILPQLVAEINSHLPKPLTEAKSEDPISNSFNEKLLNIGERVRVQLDYPMSIQGEKLHGKFRSTDIRWSTTIYTIKEVLLKPGQPPMYITSKTITRAYTKECLQPVN